MILKYHWIGQLIHSYVERFRVWELNVSNGKNKKKSVIQHKVLGSELTSVALESTTLAEQNRRQILKGRAFIGLLKGSVCRQDSSALVPESEVPRSLVTLATGGQRMEDGCQNGAAVSA